MRSKAYMNIRPSVRPVYRPLQQCAAGLLLWARPARDIGRLLHGASAAGAFALRLVSTAARRSAANASSVVFTAAVGSWTQTCSVYFYCGYLFISNIQHTGPKM